MIDNVTDEMRKKWKIKLAAIHRMLDFDRINLTDWEVGFIDSVDDMLSKNKDLSFKQSSCLTKIYNKIK